MRNLRIPEPDWASALYQRVKGMISSLSDKIDAIGGSVITQETDPTVPAWAKTAQKPTYTANEVGALPNTTVIPSKTSDLTNDGDGNSPFARMSDLPGSQTVPTKTSDLTNDGDGTHPFATTDDVGVTGIRGYAYPAEPYRKGNVVISYADVGFMNNNCTFTNITIAAGSSVVRKVGAQDISSAFQYYRPVACGLDVDSYADMQYVTAFVFTVRTASTYDIYLSVTNHGSSSITISGVANVMFLGFQE